MAYVEFNNNPLGKRVGDCTVRAISAALGEEWDKTYINLMMEGFTYKDLPSSNYVWGAFLEDRGYARYAIPNSCPSCYTVKQFCEDNPSGEFVLGTGTHVLFAKDGDYYDSWDSGDEVPVFYWKKEEE